MADMPLATEPTSVGMNVAERLAANLCSGTPCGLFAGEGVLRTALVPPDPATCRHAARPSAGRTGRRRDPASVRSPSSACRASAGSLPSFQPRTSAVPTRSSASDSGPLDSPDDPATGSPASPGQIHEGRCARRPDTRTNAGTDSLMFVEVEDVHAALHLP